MSEHRMTDRLTKYWDMLKKDNPMPAFQKFNSSAIDDIWGNCLLLSVNHQGKATTYTFYRMGDKVKTLYNGDLTGQTVTPKQKMLKGAGIIQRIDEVLNQLLPITDQGQFINEQHKVVKFRSCLLPFGSDGEVTHVIVGLSWRECG